MIEIRRMNKRLIIIASTLLVSGGVPLVWALDRRQQDRRETADYQARYSAQTDDYIKQYYQWLQMPPQERTELPLLLDKDGKTKTREQLWQEQRGRLRADVDKLASGVVTNPSLSDVLYGENWQERLDQYKKRREFNRVILTLSGVCTSAGALVYVVWLLLLTARLVVKVAAGLKGLIGRVRSSAEEDGIADESQEDTENVTLETRIEEQPDKPKPRQRIPVRQVARSTGERPRRPMGSLTQRSDTIREKQKAGALLADDKCDAAEMSAVREPIRLDVPEASKPIDNTLNDLTQQVSAIREYAANQQNRLERLQDGYDWNIIKTFCLRVIRCIDNIDNRIAQLAAGDADATHLEDVMDELVFALESSGIEQFEPEIDTEYRGQEKSAEAVKDKQSCKDPKQAGKIACVIRPGYQYFIDEENVKIVRPAQVRLYG